VSEQDSAGRGEADVDAALVSWWTGRRTSGHEGWVMRVTPRRLVPAIVVLLAQMGGCTPTERAAPEKVEAPAVPSTLEVPAAPMSTELAPGEAPVLAAPEVAEVAGLAGPPEDFGVIRPPMPVPAVAELIVHAIAGYEVVAIYGQPDLASPRLGYLKIGARTMVTAKIEDRGTGCASGFHGLPAGGFACAGKGLIVDADRPPYMYLTPPPPKIDAPIPYDYGVVVRDGTPMWWRIPDAEEVMLAGQRYDALIRAQAEAQAAVEAAKPKPAAPRPKAPSEPAPPAETPPAEAPPEPVSERLPGVTDVEAPPPVELTPEEKAEIAKREAAARKRAAERKKQQAEEERQLARKRARLPLNSQTPFMEAGYVVSLAHRVKQQGSSWWKTTRGGFVQASRVHGKETRDFHGGEVPEDARHAFGFVMSETAAASARNDKGALQWKRRLGHREFVAFAEEVEVGGRPYLVTRDGLYVRKADVRLAVPATRPAGGPGVGAVDRRRPRAPAAGRLRRRRPGVRGARVVGQARHRGRDVRDPEGPVPHHREARVVLDGRQHRVRRALLDPGCPVGHVLPRQLRAARRVLAQQVRRAAQPRVRQPRPDRRALAVLLDHAVPPRRVARRQQPRRRARQHGRDPLTRR
jgi:hypothetical protein